MQHVARNVTAIDSLICAVLSNERPPWPEGRDAADVEDFLRRVDFHGVPALLNERLLHLKGWPAKLRQETQRRAVAQAIWELHHQQVPMRVHAALACIGVQPVLFKGTALAYARYRDPMLRARGDTDFIIKPSERMRVHDVLTKLGFVDSLGLGGEFISYQTTYTFTATDGGTHCIDLHLG